MPGIITGYRAGGLPLIKCRLALPGGQPNAEVTALVDTGATHCVATAQVIRAAGLQQSGIMTNTVVGHGPRDVPKYNANVVIEGRVCGKPDSAFTYTVNDVPLLCEDLANFDIILGWDLLYLFNLEFDRNGSFSILLGT